MRATIARLQALSGDLERADEERVEIRRNSSRNQNQLPVVHICRSSNQLKAARRTADSTAPGAATHDEVPLDPAADEDENGAAHTQQPIIIPADSS
jgi:hypothetical protein